MVCEEAGGELVMAWQEQLAVRHSNLYENKRIAKALLCLIAQLTVGPPDDGEEPDKDMGFCFASQKYLAASLGCSDSEVKHWIKAFEADGWIQVIRYRNKLGYNLNRYRIVDLEKIKSRVMARDPETNEFVRAKNPNKSRSTSWRQAALRESSGQCDTELDGTLILGLGARCADPEGTVPPVVGFKQVNSEVRNREIANRPSLLLTHNSTSKQNAKPQGTPSPEPPAAGYNPPNSATLPAPTARQFVVDWNQEQRSGYLSPFPEKVRPAIMLRYEFEIVTGNESLQEDFAALLRREEIQNPNQANVNYISNAMRWAVNDSGYWEFHNSKHFCSENVWSQVRRQYEQSKKKSKARTRRRGPYISIEDNDDLEF
jgi:biotin operon repressor